MTTKRCEPAWGTCSLPSGHKGQHANKETAMTTKAKGRIEGFRGRADGRVLVNTQEGMTQVLPLPRGFRRNTQYDEFVTFIESDAAELKALKTKVRRLRKALRVSRALTGWSTQSEVDAEIAKILKGKR